MKVAIGTTIQDGPWGGGNQFAVSLHKYLLEHNVEVVFDLNSKDIDIILLTEPRSNLKSSAFTDIDIFKYLIHKNNKAIVVHRINECDERKGTTDVNKTLSLANQCADHTVFISNWLKKLFESKMFSENQSSVILNGADTNIFNNKENIRWSNNGKIKIVTHHWGGNRMKGFDIYEQLDNLLGIMPYKNTTGFTYIGTLPNGFKFNNSEHIKPLSGIELARCISQQHIYLTASQNEPAGMHHIEGALCGLPLLYRNSGALPEYCQSYGVMFDFDNFEEKLGEIIRGYEHWADRMKDYPHTTDKMCKDYYALFLQLLDQKEQVIARRNWNRSNGYKTMIKSGINKYRYRIQSCFR